MNRKNANDYWESKYFLFELEIKYYYVKKGKSSIKSDKHKIIDATHILFYNNKYFE